MSLMLKLEDGNVVEYPYTRERLQADNPLTSFPVLLTNEMLEPFNAATVEAVIAPAPGQLENLVENPPELVDGQWRQSWATVAVSEGEAAARTAEQWNVVRDERNALIAACDWTQLPDAPLSGEVKFQWATYRRDLRDVTLQSDPFAIVWPAAPGDATNPGGND